MKITKTLTLLSLTALFIAATLVSSCKYEEGPAISLCTKKARVANDWKYEKITVNGEDVTALVGSTTVITFDKDGSWKQVTDGVTDDEGTWEFSSSKDELIITHKDDPDLNATWTILKLKQKSMWVSYTEDTDKWEAHFEPK
jgi:hypothetical protein